MIYELEFKDSALKEWQKLDDTLREQFKKKLSSILKSPHIPKARLSGGVNLYKIKLKKSGYRLVYQVFDDVVMVTIIAIGKRERNDVYKTALGRLH
jgi:mRNA interferase RelE/StbE